MEILEQELLDWVNQESRKMGLTKFSHLQPLRIEASKRRYYRVENKEQSLIANTLTPKENDNHRFFVLSSLFLKNGVSVPKVFAFNPTKGFLLQEDFGDIIYQFHLNQSNSDELFSSAIDEILLIQKIPYNGKLFPALDQKRAIKEMRLFDVWFLEGLLNWQNSNRKNSNLSKFLGNIYQIIWTKLHEQPQTLCHFDFETRNLMVLKDSAGVIDFQDALIGPVTLDLVSLLKDLYRPLPLKKIKEYIALYFNQSLEEGILNDVNIKKFTLWFEWTGIQRQLRIMGTLSRLYLRDGNSNRLLDLEITLEYLIKASNRLEEMQEFRDFLIEIKPTLLEYLRSFK